MNIKTINPVYVTTNGKRKAVENVDMYWNADGSSSSQILAFQRWANNHGYKPRLVEDGISGPKTRAAFTKMGNAYAQDMKNKSYTDLSMGDIFSKMNTALKDSLGGNGGSQSSGGTASASTTSSRSYSSPAETTGGTGTGTVVAANAAADKVAAKNSGPGASPAPSEGGFWSKMDKTTKIVLIAGTSLLLIGAAIAISKKHKTVIKK